MKKSNTIAGPLAAGALTLGLLAGCGGGAEEEAETNRIGTTHDSAAREESSARQSSGDGPLDRITSKLEAARFDVSPESSGDAQAAIGVTPESGNTLTSVAFYADPNQAAVVGQQIERAFERHPGRGVVEVKDGLVLYMAQERQLTNKEKARFAEVVSIVGEGG